MSKIRVAVVGLHFGAAFVPIYQRHPNVEQVLLCDQDEPLLHRVGDRFGIPGRFTHLEELLAAHCDAVHLLTPVPCHVEHTLAALAAGKHCACAVPMATELDDLRRIIAAQRQAGKNYMMMETAAFTEGGGHGGSHPHLAHEFVRSIVEARPAAIDAVTAADWTAAGICAHASAEKEGEPVAIPAFSVV